MPDRDNYLDTDAKSVELQEKYKAHIVALLKLAGLSDAEARGGRIYDLERKIAGVHGSRADSVDVLKANNPWPLPEFAKRAPGLDWGAYFSAAGLSAQPMLMVWHPSATTGIAALAAKEPLAVWKDYLTFHAINRASPLLPKAFAEEAFRFYGTALSGQEKPRDRWKRAVGAASGDLGDAVGQLYVEKYFPPSSKAQAEAMVENIKAAFGRRIDALDLDVAGDAREGQGEGRDALRRRRLPGALARATRAWRSGGTTRSATRSARSSSTTAGASRKLGQPVDKHEWWMTPQTVNAVNLPLQNAMNFPAAILNPPFFYPGGDPVRNYGAIGTVIGHEISHSFDDQGAQFDADGRLANWWTPEDLAHFEEAAARLVAQYDAYEPLPGLHVNGKLTLSENIADVAGVAPRTTATGARTRRRRSSTGSPATSGSSSGSARPGAARSAPRRCAAS